MPKVAYHADIAAMSGKQGDQVYSEARNGGIHKSRTIPTNPNSPAQVAARQAFATGSVTYSQLDANSVAQWDEYASTLRVTDPTTGKTYSPAPSTVFTGLSAKFLQVNPTGVVPVTPPSGGFAGDRITVTVTQEDGGITWTGSGANGLAIQTELLVQKLPMTNRKPRKGGYRLKGFVGFAPGHLSQNIALASGRYACAYRFVYLQTGQTSAETPIGIVIVP